MIEKIAPQVNPIIDQTKFPRDTDTVPATVTEPIPPEQKLKKTRSATRAGSGLAAPAG